MNAPSRRLYEYTHNPQSSNRQIVDHSLNRRGFVRSLMILLLFGACLIGWRQQVMAQPTNCPDPEGCDVWATHRDPIQPAWFVGACAGCTITVVYRTRDNCLGGCDILIDTIYIPIPGCGGCTIDFMFQSSIIYSMIAHVPCAPGLGLDSCKNNTRVYMASCFSKTVDGAGNAILTSCVNSTCCNVTYKICRLGTGGQISIQKLASSGPVYINGQLPCGDIDLHVFPSAVAPKQCFMVCDEFPEGIFDITGMQKSGDPGIGMGNSQLRQQ
jgi:hypothetical protein